MRGVGEALCAGDVDQVMTLAKPAAGGVNVESLLLVDRAGREVFHIIKQSNTTIMDVIATREDSS